MREELGGVLSPVPFVAYIWVKSISIVCLVFVSSECCDFFKTFSVRTFISLDPSSSYFTYSSVKEQASLSPGAMGVAVAVAVASCTPGDSTVVGSTKAIWGRDC